MPSVADLVSHYSRDVAAAKASKNMDTNSTVARMIAHYEDDLDLNGDGTNASRAPHIRHVNSLSSSSFSSYPSANNVHDVSAYEHAGDHHLVPDDQHPDQRCRNAHLNHASHHGLCDGQSESHAPEQLTRKYGDQMSLHPMQSNRDQSQNFPGPKRSGFHPSYHQREPSNSSTIRSNDSSQASSSSYPYRSDDSSRRLSPPSLHAAEEEEEEEEVCGDYRYNDIYSTTDATGRDREVGQPSLENHRAQSDIVKKPLPKAKVVIARRRPLSVDLDAQTPSPFGLVSPRNDAVSAPGLPSFKPMFDSSPPLHSQKGNRKLVTDYSDPEELRRGRVSLINLMATNVESVMLGEDEDPDFDYVPPPVSVKGGRIYGNKEETSNGGVNRPRNRAFNYDDFMDPEAMMKPVDEEMLYDEGPSKKSNKPPRFFRLLGKNEGRIKENRRGAETRDEALHRRSSMVSGAIDRISTAADPFVDFITNAKPVGSVPLPKGRFSRLMSRIFGTKASRDLNSPKWIKNWLSLSDNVIVVNDWMDNMYCVFVTFAIIVNAFENGHFSTV